MTSEFLNSYISNLGVLSVEIDRNQRSIQLLNDNIKALTSEVQLKFKQLVVGIINQRRLQQDDEDLEARRNSQIKIIYLLIRQIHKKEDEKRSLTRGACAILDKYLASLAGTVKRSTAQHNTAEEHSEDLLKTLTSIQFQLDQPVLGNAAIIDSIKKMENESTECDKESDVMVFNDLNKNIEVLGTNENLKRLTDMVNESATKASGLIHRMDNLQVFTEKVVEICSEMKSRYGVEELSNSGSDTLSITEENEEASSTEEEYELCHCRTQQFGQMVACDNANCKIKWYHFECVGLYKSPEGMWFCPSCIIFENASG